MLLSPPRSRAFYRVNAVRAGTGQHVAGAHNEDDAMRDQVIARPMPVGSARKKARGGSFHKADPSKVCGGPS